MNNLILRSYKAGSKSGKALADALGIRRMAQKGSKWIPGPQKYVINWGSNEIEGLPEGATVINPASKVNLATNKREFFLQLEDQVRLPPFFLGKRSAADWMEEEQGIIVCRTLLRANSGRGIVMAETVEDLVDAELYTGYIKKKFEYRIHVAFNQVIDVQQKARNLDIADEDVNWQIRNHDNGFIFKREGVDVDKVAKDMAVRAVNRCGLHFGAVDLIYNERQDQYYVLEVNTAPGLEGKTLESYVNAFHRFT